MNPDYIRPYVRGQVTTPDFLVVCIPGLPPCEVAEPLATNLVNMVLDGKVEEARLLMKWFGGPTAEQEEPDAENA